MYCHTCGTYNPKDSKFCGSCGRKYGAERQPRSEDTDRVEKPRLIDQDHSPYPYVISLRKFLAMSILTCGIFNVYWFYRQWKSFLIITNHKHGRVYTALLAVMGGFSSFSLFRTIAYQIKEVEPLYKLAAVTLAVCFLILNLLYRLQDPYWLLGLSSVLPLLPVQRAINVYWQQKYGNRLKSSHFGTGNIVWSIVGIVCIFFYLSLSSSGATSSTTTVKIAQTTPSPTVVPPLTGNDIAQAVVNVACDNGKGGSGTIMLNSGDIITNNHVIAGSNSCLVTLPDPDTGTPISVYTTQPYIIPNLSKLYDIAVLSITGSYTDTNRKIWGVYPTTFPAYANPTACKNIAPKLGDPIKVYGYPVTSGGYNLTVTEGIISSFDDTGNILTSAKVDSGNSGGLAVNPQTGCYIGIPSAVSGGNYQNLGVIIPGGVVADFFEKAKSQSLTFQQEVKTDYQGNDQTGANEQVTSSEPKIDCIGLDGKHLQITQKECDAFNAAWGNVTPTPTPFWYYNPYW